MKIITVLGARPQFIKAGVVSRALRQKGIEEVIVHTGQHFDSEMSDVFFEEMRIPRPAYNLGINNLGHGAMTGRMMEKLEEIIVKEQARLTLVYGDTNSTLAGALSSVKLHVPVAHVEAGLRSFNMKMPEEVNRILTDRVSNLLFCPTKTAVENLSREGYTSMPCEIVETGDVMYDAMLFYRQEAIQSSAILRTLNLENESYLLVTVHRAENTDDLERLNKIVNAFTEIANNVKIVWPVHPRTRNKISGLNHPNILLINPVGYFDMLNLLSNAGIVMTDSGGLQKEAYMMEKFCITLRNETEWRELVDAGVNEIAGADKNKIIHTYQRFTKSKFPVHQNLYGQGNASDLIAEKIVKFLTE